MAPIESTFEIDRTPADVFAYVTDPTRFHEWQHDVVRVRFTGDTRFLTTRRIGRMERTMTQEITENIPVRRWAARGVDGPVRPHATLDIAPLDDGARSRVTVALDFTGRGIGRLIVPLFVRPAARRGSPYSYRNLKQHLES
jgi:uncharacterized protein YndB with AHSA1/START domain